jgi:uncharacterized membrane protein YgcG
MVRWKYTMRNVGLSLAAAGVGVVAAEGAAAADGVASHLVQGTVTSVGASSFTITNSKGTETIDTTTGTAYHELGTPVVPAGVADGQDVVVALSKTDSTPTAVAVTILLNSVSGQVKSVSGSTITLSAPGGAREVIVSPTTAYYSGKSTATGVTVGEWVSAFGTKDTATTPPELDADFVDIFTPPASKPPTSPITLGYFHGGGFGWCHQISAGTKFDPAAVKTDAATHSAQVTPAPAVAPAPSAKPFAPRPVQAPAPAPHGVAGGGWSGGGHAPIGGGGHGGGGSHGGGWGGGGRS